MVADEFCLFAGVSGFVLFSSESHLRFVAVLSLVSVCTLVCLCSFLVSKVLKRVAAGKLSGESRLSLL